jgi:ATP-binding cassette, subfamily B, bacterial NisT/SpaT
MSDLAERKGSEELSLRSIWLSFKLWPKIFKLLWNTNRLYFLFILFVSIIRGLLPACILLSTQFLINNVLRSIESKEIKLVLIGFTVLVSLQLFNQFTIIFDSYLKKIFNSALSNSVNLLIMKKCANLTLQAYEDALIQDMLKRARGEAGYRPFEVFMQIISIITGVVTLFSSAAILISWKWWISLILISIPFFSFISFLKIGQKEFQLYYDRAPKQREAWYHSYLLTRDNSFKEVKLYQLSNYILGNYSNILRGFFKEDKNIAKRRSLTSLGFDMLNQVAIGVTIFLVIYSTFKGELLIGSLVGMIQAINLTQNTSQSLVQSILTLCQNNLYLTQLFDFLSLKENGKTGIGNTFLAKVNSIELKNVTFKYPSMPTNAIENVSFSIGEGETLAIIGKNGSGKSTLVKLITQLYNEFEGEIRVNNIPIQDINREDFSKRIGVVFQDFVQYEMTVRNNIGFGDINNLSNNGKIIEAANKAGINRIMHKFPKGIDSQLGRLFNEGVQLSGGQWQRIAIARAFMRDADMYILDEPSAFLDPQAEHEVLEQFKKLIQNKIGIFISHRISSAKLADKIIVMDKGKICEYGDHYTLIEKGGLYAKLYEIQASSYSDRGQIKKSVTSM